LTLAELSVRRPVLTLVVSLFILLAGALSLPRLGVREYPAVDPPTLSISTTYAGAAAEVIQAQITEPIEEAVNTVPGIENLTSSSREGASTIQLEFELGTNLDTAASDVRDQLSRAARSLPADVDPPVLNKANADSDPILGLALTSDRRSQLELSAIADGLRERFQTVPGVAAVDQPAEKRYAMRLWMDPEKLQAYGLSTLDVRQALARENVELPSGRIEGESVELPVKTLSRLTQAEDFNDFIVKRSANQIVRFRDIGYAELGAQNERGSLKQGNTPIAGLYFRQQPGANQIEIVDEILRRFEHVKNEVPKDVHVKVSFDTTKFVRRSLLEVTETIFVAILLVVLVVFAFLREWRTTLIPVVAIPVSIIGAFAVMLAAGFSINTLTLLGVVLAVGLVVDDAIVVLENIYARIEAGEPPRTAAVKATNEIFFAILSTTLTLAVVFLPLLFIGGLSGRLFREFGVTIAGAVIISALVALTLTPMLCSRLLRANGGHGRLFKATEPFFQAFEAGYARLLSAFLQLRGVAVAVLLSAAALIVVLYVALPRELSPLEDRNRITVRVKAVEGVSFEWMQGVMDRIAAELQAKVPEANLFVTQLPASGVANGMNSGYVRLFLPDRNQRRRSQQKIADDLRKLQAHFAGVRINIVQEVSIGERSSSRSGVQYIVKAPDLEALREKLPAFIDATRASPLFSFVDSDLKFSKPEIQVGIDRSRAQTLGVSVRDIAQTLQAALSGQRFGYFILDGKQYDVIGQLSREYRSRPDDLGNIAVRNDVGETIRLSNLITMTESSAPPELYRVNRYAAATVTGTLVQGHTIQEGIQAFDEAARNTFDERFTTELAGSAREFTRSSSSLGWVFALALLLIYLVLAAQFESFVDPLVILLTVPLALVGALAALWFFRQTLNVFSQIGLIMLVGLVTKNAILIVEFANQRRAAGVSTALAAVREAAEARLRPILMTTLSMTLGILPIALALGAGSEARVSMGIAVVGGLITGGALTLFVIPATYVLLCGRAKRTAMEPAAAYP
jgi:hydrophobe/amphiphile efflux-1 (HAE1) family protein